MNLQCCPHDRVSTSCAPEPSLEVISILNTLYPSTGVGLCVCVCVCVCVCMCVCVCVREREKELKRVAGNVSIAL